MSSKKKSNKNWDKIPYDENLVENAIKLAERDIKTAKDMFEEENYDWSFSIVYNSMLQAGRALMFSQGFRPTGKHKHVSVVKFVEQEFSSEFADKIIFMFDKIRKKRHLVVYEQVDIISKEEAKTALDIAKTFVDKVKDMLEK